METKVSITIQHHLGEALNEIGFPDFNPDLENLAKKRILFVKWLIHKYPDTTKRVDMDVEWDLFSNEYKA